MYLIKTVLHDLLDFSLTGFSIASSVWAGGTGGAAVVAATTSTGRPSAAIAAGILIRPQAVTDLRQSLVMLVVAPGHLAAWGFLKKVGGALWQLWLELEAGQVVVALKFILS